VYLLNKYLAVKELCKLTSWTCLFCCRLVLCQAVKRSAIKFIAYFLLSILRFVVCKTFNASSRYLSLNTVIQLIFV